MSSGPRDPEARAPRPDRRDWPKAKLVVPENALREAGMGRSPCMGTSMSSTNFQQQSSFFLSYSFVRAAAEPVLDDLRRACPQWAQRSRATPLYSVDPTAAEPAENCPHQQSGIEPVRLRSPM